MGKEERESKGMSSHLNFKMNENAKFDTPPNCERVAEAIKKELSTAGKRFADGAVYIPIFLDNVEIGRLTNAADDYAVGKKVVACKDIHWDGDDAHPPGCLALKGDLLIVKRVVDQGLFVSHDPNHGAFFIEKGEYGPA